MTQSSNYEKQLEVENEELRQRLSKAEEKLHEFAGMEKFIPKWKCMEVEKSGKSFKVWHFNVKDTCYGMVEEIARSKSYYLASPKICLSNGGNITFDGSDILLTEDLEKAKRHVINLF